MKINLNIIKVLFVSFLVTSGLRADYTWITDPCILVGCDGCDEIKDDIIEAADTIDEDSHRDELEKPISEKYNDEILDDNIKKIHKIQVGITKSVARINAMEHEANMDSKKLIFLLRKNKDLYTLPLGSK